MRNLTQGAVRQWDYYLLVVRAKREVCGLTFDFDFGILYSVLGLLKLKIEVSAVDWRRHHDCVLGKTECRNY